MNSLLVTLFISFFTLLGQCNDGVANNASTNEVVVADDGKVPKVVQEAFSKKYPNEKSPDWEVDANNNYEAAFKKDGEKYRADFTPEGKWIETENDVKYSELPDAVKQIVKDSYDKDEITEIERVQHHTKGLFYDIEFKRKGKNMDVEVDVKGNVLNR